MRITLCSCTPALYSVLGSSIIFVFCFKFAYCETLGTSKFSLRHFKLSKEVQFYYRR